MSRGWGTGRNQDKDIALGRGLVVIQRSVIRSMEVMIVFIALLPIL